MKNFLEYYYNLLNITVHEKNNTYSFNYNNDKYIFINTNRNPDEINAIYKLSRNISMYYNEIILNRNNMPITYYNNKPYILLKTKYNKEDLITYKDFKRINIIESKEFEILYRNNWINLIEKKIDYIEYQREHLQNVYPILNESLDYYIGLSENAISYLNNNTLDESIKNSNLDNVVICHRRISQISKNDFYNPLNIVIDHHSRDISDYLKYLFLKDEYDLNHLQELFNNITLSKYGYILLFSRMLYPSFYFDIYEKIVNNGESESKIISIIKRSKEYEGYLLLIYEQINNKIKIPSIDWI